MFYFFFIFLQTKIKIPTISKNDAKMIKKIAQTGMPVLLFSLKLLLLDGLPFLSRQDSFVGFQIYSKRQLHKGYPFDQSASFPFGHTNWQNPAVSTAPSFLRKRKLGRHLHSLISKFYKLA